MPDCLFFSSFFFLNSIFLGGEVNRVKCDFFLMFNAKFNLKKK